MVFHAQQSNPRGKRIFAVMRADPEDDEQWWTEVTNINVPTFWRGNGINLSSTRLRRNIPEDVVINPEEVPFTSPLGESEGNLERSVRLLQEGRDVSRIRGTVNWSRIPQRSPRN